MEVGGRTPDFCQTECSYFRFYPSLILESVKQVDLFVQSLRKVSASQALSALGHLGPGHFPTLEPCLFRRKVCPF